MIFSLFSSIFFHMIMKDVRKDGGLYYSDVICYTASCFKIVSTQKVPVNVHHFVGGVEQLCKLACCVDS